MRCERLKLNCRWEERRVPLKERRRLEAEEWAATPPNIRQAQKATDLEQALDTPNDQATVASPLSLGFMYDITADTDAGQPDNIFDSISVSWTDSFSDPFMFASPTSDMVLGMDTAFSSLPSLVALTKVEHQALDYLQKELIGFGSKSPPWSTHAILMRFGSEQPMVLHLLLAASLTELSYHKQNSERLYKDAENHYQLGRSLLSKTMSSFEEPDHIAVVASFWCLYLCQRRNRKTQTISHRVISRMMRDYLQKYGLDRIMTLPKSYAGKSPSSEITSPDRISLLSRLTVWFFWTDVESCFQGAGGSIARLLLQSYHSSPTQGVLNIYERSRGALELNWGSKYPDSELADDLKNGSPLELINRTWVIVQEINEATEYGALDPSRSREIKAKIDELQTSFPFSSVFRLSKSEALVRDRLINNSDWAVCNYYALCIYHFRCSIDTEDVETSLSDQFEDIAGVVADLVLLIQKTLAAGGNVQIDRLQWPLFWAGIETSDPVYRDWILMKLINPELQAALEIALLEQSYVRRIGIGRIRMICREKCSGGIDSGFQSTLVEQC